MVAIQQSPLNSALKKNDHLGSADSRSYNAKRTDWKEVEVKNGKRKESKIPPWNVLKKVASPSSALLFMKKFRPPILSQSFQVLLEPQVPNQKIWRSSNSTLKLVCVVFGPPCRESYSVGGKFAGLDA